jgi:hypothetical protein
MLILADLGRPDGGSMSAENLFNRLMPERARQAASAGENARLHAEADTALAKAEYEFYAMQRDLQAALDVPLRHRAIPVATPTSEPAPDSVTEPEPAQRLSLAARLAAAAA